MNSQHQRLINRIIRINHAGEYAAKRIYEGQISVLKEEKILQEMLESELEHLEYFNKQIKKRKARPSLLLPLVNFVAYGLGVASAKLGKESAMACTIADEEVISDHYKQQLDQLGNKERELSEQIAKFKSEEESHHDLAILHDGKKANFYPYLSGVIKKGCEIAIKLVKYL